MSCTETAAVAAPNERKPARKNGPGQMSRAYLVRLYPTREQESLLSQWIGCCRFVWNWAVELQNTAWKTQGKKLTSVEISKALTALRQDPERPWLAEVPRASLEQVLRSQDTTWSRFFKGLQGKPDASGRRPGKPQFHSKSGKDAVRIQMDPRKIGKNLDPHNGRLNLTNLGWVECSVSEPWLGHISAVTIRRKADKWFASLTAVQVTEKENRPQRTAKVVHFDTPGAPADIDLAGIVAVDVGVATRATCSDGTVLAHPKDDEKTLQKRRRYERWFAHKQRAQLKKMGLDPEKPIPKGTRIPVSHRARRVQNQIAAFDLKDAFQRNDAIHKFTTSLVQRFHTIVVETLALHAMAKGLNRGFRRRLHRAAMGEILRQLEYKCSLYGRQLIKVDRWFPSSKKCSTPGCEFVHRKLRLSTRSWTCPECGTLHDRDRNAALNLWHEGVRLMSLPSAMHQDCPTAGSAGRDGREAYPSRGTGQPVRGDVGDEASTGLSVSNHKNRASQARTSGREPRSLAVG